MDDPALPARLIDAGVALVTERGAAAVSLREIARAAGVSHGAPRRYFPTHRDLLAGIAARGFDLLSAQVATALADSADPAARIAALSRTYVGFAAGNRGLFELMFRHELLEGNRIGLRRHGLALFQVLVDLMARARPGDPPARAEALAAAFWANLHGIAQLHAWGSLRVAVGADDVEPLLRAALTAYVPGVGHDRA